MIKNLVSGWLPESRRYRKPEDWADHVRPEAPAPILHKALPEA